MDLKKIVDAVNPFSAPGKGFYSKQEEEEAARKLAEKKKENLLATLPPGLYSKIMASMMVLEANANAGNVNETIGKMQKLVDDALIEYDQAVKQAKRDKVSISEAVTGRDFI